MKTKKVLFLTHAYNSFTKDHIESIAKKVKHVHVIVRFKHIPALFANLPINYLNNCKKSFLINTINLPENVTVILAPIFYLPTKKGYDTLGDRMYKKIINIIKEKKIKFDIIHAVFTWSAGYVGFKLKQDFNKPLFLSCYEDNDWLVRLGESNDERIYNTWKNCDFISRNNKNTLPVLRKHNINSEFVSLGYNPEKFYPINKEEAAKKINIDIKQNTFITIGALEPYKGHIFLIDAFAILKKENKEINFVVYIIGGGSQKKSLENRVNDLGLTNNIIFTGQVNHSELIYWINASDYFIMPSISESGPTIMYEALACGVPFLGTDVGAIPEIINDEKHGLYCEAGDAKQLSKIIKKSLLMRWEKDVISSYGKTFTWENTSRIIIEKYKQALEK